MASVIDKPEIMENMVVSIDMCNSSRILEDLIKTGGVQHLIDAILDMKSLILEFSLHHAASIYKFTGDGWIILLDKPYDGDVFALISLMNSDYEYFYDTRIRQILDVPPEIRGLRFGIDDGVLIKVQMDGKDEYIGRPINVACRLQGLVTNQDLKGAYQALISNRSYNKIRSELDMYSPIETRRKLRNIADEGDFSCFKLAISENRFRIIKATYGTNSNQLNVTEQYIDKIRNGELELVVTNEIAGGDPEPGVTKTLEIEYRYGKNEFRRSFREGAKIHLP